MRVIINCFDADACSSLMNRCIIWFIARSKFPRIKHKQNDYLNNDVFGLFLFHLQTRLNSRSHKTRCDKNSTTIVCLHSEINCYKHCQLHQNINDSSVTMRVSSVMGGRFIDLATRADETNIRNVALCQVIFCVLKSNTDWLLHICMTLHGRYSCFFCRFFHLSTGILLFQHFTRATNISITLVFNQLHFIHLFNYFWTDDTVFHLAFGSKLHLYGSINPRISLDSSRNNCSMQKINIFLSKCDWNDFVVFCQLIAKVNEIDAKYQSRCDVKPLLKWINQMII